MSTAKTDDPRATMESVWTHVSHSDGRTGGGDGIRAHILQAFERARRELSIKVAGSDGCFPGYDQLEFRLSDTPVTAMTVVALASDVRDGSHVVAYTCLDDSGAGFAGRVLATARATTLIPREGSQRECRQI